LTTYYGLTKNPLAKERLLELIIIQSSAVFRKTVGGSTDKHHPDWTPYSGYRYERVNFGHDLESIWLLTDACNAIGFPNAPLMDLYRTLFSYALKYGFDRKNGGFYQSGYCNAPADQRNKTWWVQAEALVAALQMHCHTGERLFFNCFVTVQTLP
jgi:mannobiose 2-epimerase